MKAFNAFSCSGNSLVTSKTRQVFSMLASTFSAILDLYLLTQSHSSHSSLLRKCNIRSDWMKFTKRDDVMNTAQRSISDGEGSECVTKAANDLDRLRIRLGRCMPYISKTKRQELETSLLTTFLCNYTNFVFMDRVHEALSIWSAANLLGRTLGCMGWTTILRGYINYSCKLSFLFRAIFMIYFTRFKLLCNIKAMCFLKKEKQKASVVPRLVFFPVTPGRSDK